MAGSVFRRCTRCPARARWQEGDRRCPRCGGDSYSWSYKVDIGRDPEGRRRERRGGGFRTKREVERALRELLAALDRDRYVERTKLTLADFLRKEWLPATAPPLVAYKTWKERRDSFERHVIPRIGEVELQKLNAAHLTGLYTELLRNGRGEAIGLSPTTVRDIHRRLRKALGDAVRWGLVERNPAELADPPAAKTVQSARRRAMRTWSEEELRKFLDATDGHRFAAVWRLAAFTGLRRSELLGLRWADIDLASRRLTVRQTVVEGEDGWVADDEQKTRGSARTIHLDTATGAMLRMHGERQRFARRAAGPAWEDHDLVFCDEFGACLSPAAVTQAFRRAAEAAGVTRIRLHDVRHTHATLLLRAGVNPKVVSERLGHSSVAFTLDTYAHVIPGMQPEAAELLATRVLGVVCDPFATHTGEDGAGS